MILDENIEASCEKIQLSDRDIFTKIWMSPRLVFRYLNENHYDKFVHILLILAGITRTFDRASSKNMGDTMSLIAVVAICIILGGLLGWITYYIYAALICWTGKWLNGQGDTKSLLRMMAHSMVPSILSLILLIPQIAVFGNGIFQSDIDVYSEGIPSMIVFFSTTFMGVILGIWTLVLFVVGISEVQKISIGKSILNMILPAVIIIIPIALFAFILGYLIN